MGFLGFKKPSASLPVSGQAEGGRYKTIRLIAADATIRVFWVILFFK